MEVKAKGRQAARSRWLRNLARVGFAAKGLLYLIIGYIAFEIAFGESGGEEADNSGALQVVAENTGGTPLLWVAAAGLAGLALWQGIHAAVGPDKATRRVAAASNAVLCAVLAVTITAFLTGGGAPESQDSQSEGMTAQLMSLPFGRFVVGAAGCGMIAVGIYQLWKAVARRFSRDLALGGLSRGGRLTVLTVGVLGYATHGLVLGAAGVFILQAAITFDKDRAQGLDGTLRAFADTPAGPPALVAVAAGVALYGAYCFCLARWSRD
ncbi:DUF1206 domain-containing protein [Nocardiopsis sp. CT-R113]|uniref:DUF1206 domain-containing protein n=1 Tax=Nocardiopsis codii TaxID=3065942 RepID=A0ABU7KBW0_9ACTN|nr:DUF1206 domain-containing protein [Nocardiopsis sp. CT-R113]MEE2039711.1 DUF1206 domain-containing protein [Nocardiopsis sp. CT-R113]